MSLVKDCQGKTHKLNYLFTYLPIFLLLCDIIIYYNFYPITHIGVKLSLTCRLILNKINCCDVDLHRSKLFRCGLYLYNGLYPTTLALSHIIYTYISPLKFLTLGCMLLTSISLTLAWSVMDFVQ